MHGTEQRALKRQVAGNHMGAYKGQEISKKP